MRRGWGDLKSRVRISSSARRGNSATANILSVCEATHHARLLQHPINAPIVLKLDGVIQLEYGVHTQHSAALAPLNAQV